MNQAEEPDSGTIRKSPSEKYKPKDIKPGDVVVDKPDGEHAPVAYLPVAEMPSKKIFGEMDPLEGSPAREMTNKLLAGDLPLGDFIKKEDKAGL